jgi:hypothetical protein
MRALKKGFLDPERVPNERRAVVERFAGEHRVL